MLIGHTSELHPKIKPLESFHTRDERCWKHILGWMNECTLKNPACHRSNSLAEPGNWPSRFIAVGDTGSPIIKLCQTVTLDLSTTRYMTLSHCWGKFVPTSLLKRNLSSFLAGIAIDDLPKTFREAVEVTRKLSIRFLWIDSLCIIQDSTDDWTIESSKMYHIYKNTYLNIAAAISENATGGLFYPRSPLFIGPCVFEIGKTRKKRAMVEPSGTDDSQMLLTRAWVFQDWLLASRTILFGKELRWECNELKASETLPDLESVYQNISPFRRKNMRGDWVNLHKKDDAQRWVVWNSIIDEYSQKELTIFSDKLVALSGLSSELGKVWDGVNYLAGHWSYRFLRTLLWSTKKNGPQHTAYTTPSWSWAAIDGSIKTPKEDELSDCLIESMEAKVRPREPLNPYGCISDGYFRLQGPLLCVTIIKDNNARWDAVLLGRDLLEKGEGGPMIQGKIPINITWDKKGSEELILSAKVHLAPCEVFLMEHGDGLSLQGLILEPTYLKT